MHNTYTLEQVEAWVDRNQFIGSPEAARTAMEDAAGLPRLQMTYEQAMTNLKHYRGEMLCQSHGNSGLAYREMEARGLVTIEESPQPGFIKVILL